jgi:hypothetical protein
MLPIFNDASTNFLGVRILGGDPCSGSVRNELRMSPSQSPSWKLLTVRKLGGDATPGFARLTGHRAANLEFFAVRILGGDSVGSITACQISEEYPKSFGRTHFGW